MIAVRSAADSEMAHQDSVDLLRQQGKSSDENAPTKSIHRAPRDAQKSCYCPPSILMKPTRLRRAFFKHGIKTSVLMILLLTPVAVLSDYMPNWLSHLLFFGLFLAVILPVHFGVGRLGRWLAQELNDAAIADDRDYKKSLGPPRSTKDPDEHLG
jgi:hypothetical protein